MIARVLLCLLLAGCAAPAVRIETVPVNVPVMVPCVLDRPKPPESWPADRITQGMNIFDQVKLLLADIEERKAYQLKLIAASAGCLQVPSTTQGGAP